MGDKTDKLIKLGVGLILIALSATGIQIFFVGFMTEYDVPYNDSGLMWGNLTIASEEYANLSKSISVLEKELGEEPDTGTLSDVVNFFDITWNSVKTAASTMGNSIDMSIGMIGGAGDAIPGVDGWLVGGLIAIVMLAIVFLILGWWMNR